jgi:hypothetical protein
MISLEEITKVPDLITPDGMLRIYPNPVSDVLFIEPAERMKVNGFIRIELYAVHGTKLMDSGKMSFNESGIGLNINSLGPGTYLMDIHYGDRHYQSLVTIN